MSAWFIQECKRHYEQQGQEFTYDQLEEMASDAPAFQYFFDPDDDRFYQPENMPTKIQAYCMEKFSKQPESIGEMFRCIFESLAMKFRQIIEQLEYVSGKSLPTIYMFGGGSKSTMLCQFVANATGNTALQLVAIGVAKDIEEAKRIMKSSYSTTNYTPQDTETWNEHYSIFDKKAALDTGL